MKMKKWAAAGFKDTLLRCEMKLEIFYGNEKEIQPGVQARGGEDGPGRGGALKQVPILLFPQCPNNGAVAGIGR